MNKKLFSRIMIGTITGALTAISGIVTYGFVRLAQDEAKRDLVKRAAKEHADETDHSGE